MHTHTHPPTHTHTCAPTHPHTHTHTHTVELRPGNNGFLGFLIQARVQDRSSDTFNSNSEIAGTWADEGMDSLYRPLRCNISSAGGSETFPVSVCVTGNNTSEQVLHITISMLYFYHCYLFLSSQNSATQRDANDLRGASMSAFLRWTAPTEDPGEDIVFWWALAIYYDCVRYPACVHASY